jgi:two-component system NtrC family sensor kinase
MNTSVLILDDSLTVRMDLARAFASAGFRTILCGTAKETRMALHSDLVGLIVLDMSVSDIDGVELLSELQASPSTAHIPVLMLSDESDVKFRIQALQLGADDYVGKPYEAHYVVARAQQLLGLGLPDEGPTEASTSVLLIDDSLTFRNRLGTALEEAGFDVLTAASGEDGLLLAGSNRPAAILVDGIMPGIDGPTVIRRVRLDPVLRHTPCLLLTGEDEDRAEIEALESGADAFVRKEDDMSVVLAQLRAALRRSEVPPPLEQAVSVLSRPQKILVVDGSPAYSNQLAASLRSEGFDIVLAHSGEETLALLAVQPVDCIMLDVQLPGLSGEDTCRRLKGAPSTRDIPLIMLSGLPGREVIVAGLAAGADDYMSKTTEFDVVKARVRAQIRRRQFEEETRHARDELMQRKLAAAEAHAAHELAETRARLVEQLEHKNRELEAFSYSVSHDLRAPLRSIDGFSLALFEEYADRLDATGLDYLQRVRGAAERMGGLINDLLNLSKVASGEPLRTRVDLCQLARSSWRELERSEPNRHVSFVLSEGLFTHADARLMRVVLDNLLGNARKFTRDRMHPRVEFSAGIHHGVLTYMVRDNGVGFDMAYESKLFRPFQRSSRERAWGSRPFIESSRGTADASGPRAG